MPNDSEKELQEFLSSLPSIRRKELEHGKSTFSENDWQDWARYITEHGDTRIYELGEYQRLVQKIPALWREYRARQIVEASQSWARLLPANPEGRPRKDTLAAEAAQLKKSGLSYAQISRRLNRERGEGTTTKESVRKLLNNRKPKSALGAASPPDKT